MRLEDIFARFRQIDGLVNSRNRSARFLLGEHKSRIGGDGYDILGIKEWESGEPLTDVAWGPSLLSFPKTIYQIERMEPKQMPVVLAVDLSHSVLLRIADDENKAILMLELIGILGLSHARFQDPVGVLGFSEDVEMFFRPKPGKRRIYYAVSRIFERIETELKQPRKRKTDYSAMFRFIDEKVKPRSRIICISDFVDVVNRDANEIIDFELLRRLSAKHEVIVIITDDQKEFRTTKRLGYIRLSDIETGRPTIVPVKNLNVIRKDIEKAREEFMANLTEVGIKSLVLSYGEHLDELRRFAAAYLK